VRRRFALAAAGAVAAAAGVLVPATGAGAVLCTTDQVTETVAGRTSGTSLNIDGEGGEIIFESDAAINGANADLNTEIYTFARIGRATNVATGSTAPATSGTPDSDATGNLEVYASTANPLTTNADGNLELFVRNPEFGTLRQVTNTTGGALANRDPSVDDGGDRIVFLSDRNLGGFNPDLNREVYLASVFGPIALTSSTGGGGSAHSEAEISGDGRYVVYASTREPPGTANGDGNREVFRLEIATGAVDQVTQTIGGGNGSEVVAISGNGSRVAFRSTANLTGGNGDGGAELFLRDFGTGTTTQLTSTTPSNQPLGLAISGDGSRVSYASPRGVEPAAQSVGPEGITQRDLLIRDLDTNTLTEVAAAVDTTSGVTSTAINDRGTRIAFGSLSDHTGANPERNHEVFLATCGRAVPVFTDVGPGATFFEQIQWMSGAQIADGFPDGTFRPQDLVKRQQMANFLFNAAAAEFLAGEDPTFPDVPNANPFYNEIEWMVAVEVADGFPDGTFRPQDFVKRQQMANFLYNLAGQPPFTPPSSPTFPDVPTSNPFFLQVEWMVSEGVATGFPDGTFRPQDSVKRQQMANFLFNFIDQVGVDESVI
jgi:Tol biopolymer transport system component